MFSACGCRVGQAVPLMNRVSGLHPLASWALIGYEYCYGVIISIERPQLMFLKTVRSKATDCCVDI